MHKAFDSRLDQGWWALRIGLGVGPSLAGLDKILQPLGQLARRHESIGPKNSALQRANLYAYRWPG